MDYSNIYGFLFLDTIPYMYRANAPNNVSSYDMYRFSGTQPVLISRDTFNFSQNYGPQAFFNVVDSSFYRVDLTYTSYSIFHSGNAGTTWQQVGSVSIIPGGLDYQVAQDSAFILIGDTIYVYDHSGHLCHKLNEPSVKKIWVTDTTILLFRTSSVTNIPRSGGNGRNIATPAQFNRTTFAAMGWKAGYIFLSVDSDGVYVLPPDSTRWKPFNQGLTNLTANVFYFNDSFAYVSLSGWLWRRQLSDLTAPSMSCANVYNTMTHAICQGDSFIFGSRHLIASGTYTDTLTSLSGCDSIVTLTLTVNGVSNTSLSKSICMGSTYVFGGHTLTSAGSYTDTLTSSAGCDSITQLVLHVNPLPVVTLTWDSLLALHDLQMFGAYPTCCSFNPYVFPMLGGMPAGGHYQGGYIINDIFYRGSSGSWITRDTVTYLYIDPNGCKNHAQNYIYISICEGINDISNTNPIKLYPNPNTGTFTLETVQSINSDYTIYDVLGKIVQQQSITADKQLVILPDAPDGVYTLVVKGAQPVRFVLMRNE